MEPSPKGRALFSLEPHPTGLSSAEGSLAHKVHKWLLDPVIPVAKKERERLEFNILKELEQLAYKEKAVKAGFIQFGEHFWGRSYCYSPLVKVLRR